MKNMIIDIYLRNDYEYFEMKSSLVEERNSINISMPLIGIRDLADEDEDEDIWYYTYDCNCLVAYTITAKESYYYS